MFFLAQIPSFIQVYRHHDSCGETDTVQLHLKPAHGSSYAQFRGPSCLPWPLGIAADNLYFLGMDLALVLQLEGDILYEKRPDFIAEPVGIQMALCKKTISAITSVYSPLAIALP